MKVSKSAQAELPLTEASCYILLSLAPRARHGYAIMKDVNALSGGRVDLSTGTLYGALKRMLEHGWIQPVDLDPEAEAADGTGRERKAYTLTEYGRRVLQAEVERLQRLGEIGRLRTSGSKA
jgi:DNA-binding PadR family transcriptional regulator